MKRILMVALLALVAAPATAAPPPPLEAYGRLPAIETISLSPSGEAIAFVGVAGDKRRLAVTTVQGKALLVSDVGDLKLRDLDWVGDEIVVAYASQTVGLRALTDFNYELRAATVFDLKTKTSHVAFDKKKLVNPTIFGFYGYRYMKGRWLGFYANQTLEHTADGPMLVRRNRDLYSVDLLTDSIDRLARDSTGERERDWVIGVDGEILAVTNYDKRSGAWELSSGDKTLLAKTSPLQKIDAAGLGRRPDTVLVIDGEGDDDRLIEVPLDPAAKPEPLWADLPWTSTLHTRAGLLIGVMQTGALGAVFSDPVLTARYRGARKAFPDNSFTLVSYTDDLKRMIVLTDGADDAGTYWFVDISTGAAKPIGYVHPDIPSEAVGPTRTFDYKAADGTPLDGVLTLPPGAKRSNLPVVIMPHGGPIGVEDTVGFDFWAQAFASRGYAVFQPNYRGSSGRGPAFREAGYGEWGRKMLSDISDGLKALASEGIADPKRACIVGASYGGYAALAGVTVQQGLYRCAVSVSGVADPAQLIAEKQDRLGDVNSTTRFWRKAMGVGVPGAPTLSDISPLKLAGRADAPLLLIHGVDDVVVPIAQSQAMNSALKGAGKSVEFISLPGEDHWLSTSTGRQAMVKASVEFVMAKNPAD